MQRKVVTRKDGGNDGITHGAPPGLEAFEGRYVRSR